MTEHEAKVLALTFVEKGRTNMDDIRYDDRLYDATDEEVEIVHDYIVEIIEEGVTNFRLMNDL